MSRQAPSRWGRLLDSPVGVKENPRWNFQQGFRVPRSQLSQGRHVPQALQDEEDDSVLFPKTLPGRKASAFSSLVRQSYTTLTQTLL